MSQHKYTIELYKDTQGEHRWRVRAANGQIVIPPEGYKNHGDMVDIITKLQMGGLRVAKIVRVDS